MEKAEWSTVGGGGLGFKCPEFGMRRASSTRVMFSGTDRGLRGGLLGGINSAGVGGESPGWTRKRGSKKKLPCGIS